MWSHKAIKLNVILRFAIKSVYINTTDVIYCITKLDYMRLWIVTFSENLQHAHATFSDPILYPRLLERWDFMNTLVTLNWLPSSMWLAQNCSNWTTKKRSWGFREWSKSRFCAYSRWCWLQWSMYQADLVLYFTIALVNTLEKRTDQYNYARYLLIIFYFILSK